MMNFKQKLFIVNELQIFPLEIEQIIVNYVLDLIITEKTQKIYKNILNELSKIKYKNGRMQIISHIRPVSNKKYLFTPIYSDYLRKTWDFRYNEYIIYKISSDGVWYKVSFIFTPD